MDTFIDFDLSDPPSFAIGLFLNVLSLQHLQVRDTVRALHGMDPESPDLRRPLAESAVDLVLRRFPEPSARELEARREDLVRFLEDRLSPTDGPPKPRLRVV